jgi:hypothetical protein
LIKIKEQLYKLCVQYVDQRIATASDAIQTAQTSANEETKSSAGDKYETGRAMMQLEIEKNTVQLNEAQKLRQILVNIDPQKQALTVRPGSLVVTDQGNFYIGIGAGQLKLDGHVYFAVASTSPIGIQLMNKSKNDTFLFNKKSFHIKEVW